jgi:xanthine dehydrogenase small subunit
VTPRSSIRFLRRGKVIDLGAFPPTQTVLDYLRLVEGSTGTKEGCNEGDCGACTVALGSLQGGNVVYAPANACILLVGQLDGKDLVTVDDLAQDGVLHPVQQAMVEAHASQCGFCTPGFVMSLFTLYHAGTAPTRQQIVDHLAGNLCRCTGYRPIIDAALKACDGHAADRWAAQSAQTAAQLAGLNDERDVLVGSDESFFAAPATPEALAAFCAAHPDATILAGATDIGLWITKQMRSLPKLAYLGRAAGLETIADAGDHLQVGAGATYQAVLPHLAAIDSDIDVVLRRIGAAQVRSSATLCGNIANGSPIGDGPPILIALGARLHLRHGTIQRALPLEDFFIAYGKQDRKAGELVWQVDIPKLAGDEVFRCYKLSKRADQDISAVMAAFKFKLKDGAVVAARVAFGGMAATPKRAAATERALVSYKLGDLAAAETIADVLAQDFQPISDMRASATYRLEAAKGLLKRALIEISGSQAQLTRSRGFREVAHG